MPSVVNSENNQEQEGSNTQVYSAPPTLDPSTAGDNALPKFFDGLPEEPSQLKQHAFNRDPKGVATRMCLRPDLDRRHVDRPHTKDWQRTRSYLIALFGRALKVGCQRNEVLWYAVRFIREHAPPQFFLTQQSFETMLRLASGRLRGLEIRQRNRARRKQGTATNKPRKTRADKNSGQRLKQVARLIERDLGYRRIADVLSISPYTARDYCRAVRERGGPDAILLRPRKASKPVLETPLAALLHQVCQEGGISLQFRTANRVIQNVTRYACEIGLGPALPQILTRDTLPDRIQMFLRHTVRKPEARRRHASLTRSLETALAEVKCRRSPAIRLLSALLVKRGLPIPKTRADGSVIRSRYCLPTAVRLATTSFDRYFLADPSEEDVEAIFRDLELRRTVTAAPIPFPVEDIAQLRERANGRLNSPAAPPVNGADVVLSEMAA